MPSNSKASVSVVIGADLGKSFKTSFGSANKQLSSLGNAIKKTSQSVNQIEAYRNSARATKEAGIAYKQAKQKLNLLSQEVKSSISPSKRLQNEFRKAKNLADRTKKSFLDTARSTRQMGKALKDSGVDIRNFNRQQTNLNKRLNVLRNRQTAITRNQSAKEANLQKRSDHRSQMFDAVALGGALFSIVKPAADFELAMAKVGAITKEAADSKGFKDLTKQARELGRTTQFTAGQAGEAMQFLGMAGLNTNQILEATPSVLNLAIAGNMDLGRTADIASNILTGFNMEASRTAEVADILAQASRSTNVNVEMLGQTMKFVAPAAAAVGGTLAETASLAGVLGDAGIQATMAGTMLRSAYLRLAAPAKSGAKALEKMRDELGLTAEEMPDVSKQALLAQKRLFGIGVRVFDEKGKMRSMVTILQEMAVALKDASDEEKLSTIKDIFGTRAASGALAIFKSVETGRLDEVVKKIEDADGAAEEMASRLRNTAHGAWKEFLSASESVGISLGSVLLPAFVRVAKGAANVASKISAFAEANPVLTKNIGLVVAGLISFKVASIGLGFAFTFLKGGLLSMHGGLIALKTVISLVGFALPPVIAAVKALGIAVLTNPIGLVVAGIAASAFLLIKYWKPISQFFKEIFEGIVGWVQKAFNWVGKLIEPLKKVTNLAGKAVNFVFGDDEEENSENSENQSKKPIVGNVVRTFERENVEGSNQQQFFTTNNDNQQQFFTTNNDNQQQEFLNTNNNQRSLTTNNSISRIAGNNTRSNISISSPITINSTGQTDERKIADQVKIALDETFRQFDVRKQALNYD